MNTDWLPHGCTVGDIKLTLVNDESRALRIALEDEGSGFYVTLHAEEPFSLDADELKRLAGMLEDTCSDINLLNGSRG